MLAGAGPPLHYSDYHRGQGAAFHEQACKLELEGIVSKRADAAYAPGNRGIWLKVKCLHREEFVVVGWTDPEGRRPYLGALLLAYYDPDGRLVYAGRAGTGINTAELERLWRRLQPLATDKMPLDVPPPRGSRFGSPLVLSRVHWVRPELVAEVKFLTWTDDNLLRQVVYEGLREDKPAARGAAGCAATETRVIRSLRLSAPTSCIISGASEESGERSFNILSPDRKKAAPRRIGSSTPQLDSAWLGRRKPSSRPR